MIQKKLIVWFVLVSAITCLPWQVGRGELSSGARKTLASWLHKSRELNLDPKLAKLIAGRIPSEIVESMLGRKADYIGLDVDCLGVSTVMNRHGDSQRNDPALWAFSGIISGCYLCVIGKDSTEYSILWDTTLAAAYPGPSLGTVRLGIERDSSFTVQLGGGPSPGGWAPMTLLEWSGGACTVVGDFSGSYYETIDKDNDGIVEILLTVPSDGRNSTNTQLFEYDRTLKRYREVQGRSDMDAK